MKKKSVISLRTQSVNLGDYLILVCSIDYLLSRYNRVILDSKNAPATFVKAIENNYQSEIENGIISIQQLGLFSYLFNRFDFFRKAGALSSNGSFKAKISYALKAVFNLYRRAFGFGNAYLFPISIAGTLNRGSKLFFKSFKHVFVRDRASFDILRSANIAHVTQVPDMSHYMYVDGSKRAQAGLTPLTASVSFRYDRSPPVSQVKRLTESNSIQITHAVTQVLYDSDVSAELATAFGATHYVSTIDSAGIEGVKGVYSKCDVVISNRLHVLLLGMLVGATPIPFVKQTDTKVMDYFASFGYSYLDIEQSFSEETFAQVYHSNSKAVNLADIKKLLEDSLNEFII